MGFREENRLLIYVAAVFGLYLRSLETVTSSRWTVAFLTLWSKLPVCLFPVYIGFDVNSLLFDKASILVRMAMFRKVVAFGSFYCKNVLFYLNRRKIENLFDSWDDSFKEEFYPHESRIYQNINREENKRLLRLIIGLSVFASLSYSIPAYFSQKKTFTHPTGIKYPHRSPEFEVVVTFDVICSVACVSSAAFDCILVILLSHVRFKLEFLRDALADIINEVTIDESGRLLGRRGARLRSYDSSPPPREGGDEKPARVLPQDVWENSSYEETEPNGEEFKGNVANVDAKLRVWVLHHQQTISVFEEVKKVYSSTATLEIGYVVVYTALTALQLVQVRPGPVVLGISLVASCNLMSLFLWSKLGADLQGINPFGDGFARAWFLFPKKIKSAFSLIIMRSQKPLTLYGIALYEVNLVTFFEILKLTYQFFAFMTQFTEKED